MKVYGRNELDEMNCPGCDGKNEHKHGPLIVSGKCHGGAPVVVAYQREDGILVLHCSECHAHVAAIQVGTPEPAPKPLPTRPFRVLS